MRSSGFYGPLLIFSSIALIACSSGGDGGTILGSEVVFGSGDVVVETLAVTGCTEVAMAGIGALHIEQGTSETLRIETDDNILPHVSTELSGSVLQIGNEPGFDLRPSRLDYYVTVLDLTGIAFSGVGSVELAGLTTTTLSVTLTGVGTAELYGLDVDDLRAAVTGVGDLIASGEVDDQAVTLAGVGDYLAAGLASRSAGVLITGGGSATLCVTDNLAVTITGLGTVSFYGNPALQGDVSVSDRLGATCP